MPIFELFSLPALKSTFVIKPAAYWLSLVIILLVETVIFVGSVTDICMHAC